MAGNLGTFFGPAIGSTEFKSEAEQGEFKMKLTDWVVQYIRDLGVDTVFGLTGGAVVHIFDSVERTDGIKNVFCHHEQAAALAAQSYAKIKNHFGCAVVTTGPGGTNAVTGVLAAYQDSLPCIFLSGQARRRYTPAYPSIRYAVSGSERRCLHNRNMCEAHTTPDHDVAFALP